MKMKSIAAMLVLSVSAGVANAEPTTAEASVVYVRPYMLNGGAGAVYFKIDRVDVCNTDIYVIDLAWGGSKQALAAVMLAFAGGNRIRVEVDNSGCATPAWSTKAQSVYLVK